MTEESHNPVPEVEQVIVAAQRLGEQKDEEALELQLGMRADAIARDAALADAVALELRYDTTTMGPLDEIRRLGRRILNRWNRELYRLVCPGTGEETEERKKLVEALNLGEAAVIAAVASILLSTGVAAALVAPLAPLIVRRFIMPAKNELCDAWGEAIEERG